MSKQDGIGSIFKAVQNCGSVYKTVHLAVRRTQELAEKEEHLSEAKGISLHDIALDEIAQGKINWSCEEGKK